jgi:hypothetical protein
MATKVNIPTGLGGVIDNVDAFDDLADTIANPPAGRPLKEAIGRSGQKYCDFYGALPQAAKDLLGPGFAASGLLCKPYWDGAGYDPPEEEASFTGGQCVDVNYQVDGTYECTGLSDGSGCGTTRNFRINLARGPISGMIVTFSPPEFRVANGGRFSTGAYDTVTFGSFIAAEFCAPAGGGNQRAKSAKITSVTRLDGLPDSCGSPPADLVPGDNPPPVPTFPPGEEPGVDPDGQPYFFVPPIENPVVGGDPVPVPEPSPDGGGTGGGPTSPPVAGDEQSGTPGDEEFPPPEDGRRWVGCCIRLTSVPVGTGTVPGTAPETILTQVVGNARLLFDSVSGDGYDTPVQIRSAGLCLWEPIKGLSPKGVRVNLKPGFEYAYTPYSVEETE